MMIAPAARRRATGNSSIAGLKPASARLPQVEGSPATWMLSLIDKGMPSSGERGSPRAKRASLYSCVTGIPVHDHRKLARQISAEQWSEIEETVDSCVRILPLYALLTATWRRSFAIEQAVVRAA